MTTKEELMPYMARATEILKVSASDVQVGGNHYRHHAIQPIDFIEANKLSFAEGCVIKYIMRYKEKNGIEDLNKPKHYIDLIIENYTKEQRTHGS